MKGLVKKVVALATVTIMAMTALTGCIGDSFDAKKTAIEIDKTKVSAAVANFYMRYQQKGVEEYNQMLGQGKEMWSQDLGTGSTYEEYIKEKLVDEIIELYLVREHMADYKVALTEEENQAIDAAAKTFVEANTEEDREKVSGDYEVVKEVLELITIQEKMREAIEESYTRDISDEEAAHKKMSYVKVAKVISNSDGSTTQLSEAEIAEAKKQAEQIMEASKAAGKLTAIEGIEVQELAFDKENKTLGEDVMKVANALGEGELSDMIETEDGFYVLQLTSLLDREATDLKKSTLLQTEKEKHYQNTCAEWKEKSKISIKQNVIDTIRFTELEVQSPTVG